MDNNQNPLVGMQPNQPQNDNMGPQEQNNGLQLNQLGGDQMPAQQLVDRQFGMGQQSVDGTDAGVGQQSVNGVNVNMMQQGVDGNGENNAMQQDIYSQQIALPPKKRSVWKIVTFVSIPVLVVIVAVIVGVVIGLPDNKTDDAAPSVGDGATELGGKDYRLVSDLTDAEKDTLANAANGSCEVVGEMDVNMQFDDWKTGQTSSLLRKNPGYGIFAYLNKLYKIRCGEDYYAVLDMYFYNKNKREKYYFDNSYYDPILATEDGMVIQNVKDRSSTDRYAFDMGTKITELDRESSDLKSLGQIPIDYNYLSGNLDDLAFGHENTDNGYEVLPLKLRTFQYYGNIWNGQSWEKDSNFDLDNLYVYYLSENDDLNTNILKGGNVGLARVKLETHGNDHAMDGIADYYAYEASKSGPYELDVLASVGYDKDNKSIDFFHAGVVIDNYVIEKWGNRDVLVLSTNFVDTKGDHPEVAFYSLVSMMYRHQITLVTTDGLVQTPIYLNPDYKDNRPVTEQYVLPFILPNNYDLNNLWIKIDDNLVKVKDLSRK